MVAGLRSGLGTRLQSTSTNDGDENGEGFASLELVGGREASPTGDSDADGSTSPDEASTDAGDLTGDFSSSDGTSKAAGRRRRIGSDSLPVDAASDGTRNDTSPSS